MKKTICLIIVCIFFYICWINEVFAYTDVQVNLSSDKNTIKAGEEIEIILSIKNAKTAAFTTYIYFDDSYLEFVKGPKMSKLDNNKIIYVWYDEDGVGNSKDGELARFTFKAKKEGDTSFNTNGEFYDEDGDLIKAVFNNFEIKIGEVTIGQETGEIKVVNEEVDETNNTNLETLAIEDMLLYPHFDNNITSYNFEVPNYVKDLNILAIPENPKAKVEITGGTNLVEGKNLVKIIVTAEDGNNKKIFDINGYKRNKEEEQIYSKKQEDNKKSKEDYSTHNVSNEIEIVNEYNSKKLVNDKEKEKNMLITFTIIIVAFLIGFILKSKYRNIDN